MGIPLNVLIIDDSEDDALLILRELRQGGYEPMYERVETAEDMKELLAKQSWDIIISDYVMPRFSGLDALKLLQETGIDLPFILVSGLIGEETAVEAMKAGAHDYIMKGNLSRLGPAVKRELREADVRQDRRQVREALKESEILYRTIFETTGTALVIDEEDTTISLVNEEYEKLTGYSKEELEGKRSWTEFIVKEDLDRIKEYHRLRRISPDAVPTNYVFRLIERQGNVKHILATVSMIPETKKSLASLLDITKRKLAEEALKESERKLRLITENMRDTIFAYDMNNQLLYVNPAFEILTGYTTKELYEQNFIDYIHPDDKARMIQLWEGLFQGKAFSGVEFRIVAKDGQIKWCSSSWSPLIDEEGRQIGIQGREVDITERKRAEEKLLKSEKELKKRVKELEEFYQIAVGRELRMKELKEEIESLRNELKQYKKS